MAVAASRKVEYRRRATPLEHPAYHARINASEHSSIALPRPKVTEYNRLVIVPVMADGEEPPGGVHGSPGRYRVVFVLGVPGIGSVATDLDLASLEASGDSLIVSEELEVNLEAEDEQSTWLLHTNDSGHLSHAAITLQAETLETAEESAHNQVTTMLSRLSFEANAATEIKATIVTELATGTVSVGATLVGTMRPVQEIAGNMNPELSPLLATYRDALGATSPLYQALAFYRVAEGVDTLHRRASRAAAKSGTPAPADPLAIAFPRAGDTVAEVDALDASEHSHLAGKSLREVWASHRDTMRNAVAHLTPGRGVVVADRLADLNQCRTAIPALRYVARKALEAEIARANTP